MARSPRVVHHVPMPKAMAGLTLGVEFTGLRRASARISIATWLMRFAAWAAGCGVDIKASLPALGGDIPRAVSVNEDDPRYRDGAAGSEIIVLLDGVEQDAVATYDMDAGFVEVLDRDSSTLAFVRRKGVVTAGVRPTRDR